MIVDIKGIYMKKFAALLSLSLSFNLFAAAALPMNVVEETTHVLIKNVKARKIDASFLTNVLNITIQSTSTGFETIASAPSANDAQPNTVTIEFDLQGKAKTVKQNFVSAYPKAPIFVAADAATLFDLGAEAVVDHLAENADLPEVAKTAISVKLMGKTNGADMKIQLSSGKIYNISMDQNGNVLSQGY